MTTAFTAEATATETDQISPELVADTNAAFWSAASDDSGFGRLSFDRCVNWLLDLYQDSSDTVIRTLIADVLDDLRALGPFEGEFEDVVLGALASIETAIEIRSAA